MIAILFAAALAALYAKFNSDKKKSKYTATKKDQVSGVEIDKEKLQAGLSIKNLYKNDRVILKKLSTGQPPFAGVTRGNAPRAPNLYLTPVRNKEVSRIDWRKPSNQIFTTDEYKNAFKRMHQITHGTPKPAARQGGLDVGWGHSKMKGNPIHQSKVQHWVSMDPSRPSHSEVDPAKPNNLVNHRNLLPWVPSKSDSIKKLNPQKHR